MTLQTKIRKYHELHPVIKESMTLEEYIFTYGTLEELREYDREALQLYAETNPEVV